jgi:hypothetical protein
MLVEEHGALVGLLTLKDALREVAAHEARAQRGDTELEDVLEELGAFARRRLDAFWGLAARIPGTPLSRSPMPRGVALPNG